MKNLWAQNVVDSVARRAKGKELVSDVIPLSSAACPLCALCSPLCFIWCWAEAKQNKKFIVFSWHISSPLSARPCRSLVRTVRSGGFFCALSSLVGRNHFSIEFNTLYNTWGEKVGLSIPSDFFALLGQLNSPHTQHRSSSIIESLFFRLLLNTAPLRCVSSDDDKLFQICVTRKKNPDWPSSAFFLFCCFWFFLEIEESFLTSREIAFICLSCECVWTASSVQCFIVRTGAHCELRWTIKRVSLSCDFSRSNEMKFNGTFKELSIIPWNWTYFSSSYFGPLHERAQCVPEIRENALESASQRRPIKKNKSELRIFMS